MTRFEKQDITVRIAYEVTDHSETRTVDAKFSVRPENHLLQQSIDTVPGTLILALVPLGGGWFESFRQAELLPLQIDVGRGVRRRRGRVTFTFSFKPVSGGDVFTHELNYRLTRDKAPGQIASHATNPRFLLFQEGEKSQAVFRLVQVPTVQIPGVQIPGVVAIVIDPCSGCRALDLNTPGFDQKLDRCLRDGCGVGTV